MYNTRLSQTHACTLITTVTMHHLIIIIIYDNHDDIYGAVIKA